MSSPSSAGIPSSASLTISSNSSGSTSTMRQVSYPTGSTLQTTPRNDAVIHASEQVVEPPPSVVHRFDPELSQLGHTVAHLPDHLRRWTLPARDLFDDPQWLGGSVGPSRVPGEALVG